MAGAVELSVVVASHDRPLRLRWLLNALEDQTVGRDRWEVVVAHDSRGPETEELLRSHPLAAGGTLHGLRFAPGSAGPAQKRNAAWRLAQAPLIVFTDDDCRPPAEWLERTLEAAAAHPGAIVQGATRPDPDEAHLIFRTAHAHSQEIDPPIDWAQTCNIAYPRALLERAGGFDEGLPIAAGEDTDLALRARAQGADYAGAQSMLTYHAVESLPLHRLLSASWRWQHLPYVVRRHPRLRRLGVLGVFWKPSHAWLALAAAGAGLALRRRPLALTLALPWAHHRLPPYGPTLRGRLRAASELPGRALQDATEFAALAYGSVRARTLFL